MDLLLGCAVQSKIGWSFRILVILYANVMILLVSYVGSYTYNGCERRMILYNTSDCRN